MSKKRTITLTGRPPVTISEDTWPLVADARGHDYDGEYDFRSNRDSFWFVGVRKHQDGRAIVYATYSYSSNWQNERDVSAKRGVLLDADQDVCEAIYRVCNDIADAEHHGTDAERWGTLMHECVADMPAEVLE